MLLASAYRLFHLNKACSRLPNLPGRTLISAQMSNQASQRPNAWNNSARVSAWKKVNARIAPSPSRAPAGNTDATTGPRAPQPVTAGGKVLTNRLSCPLYAVRSDHTHSSESGALQASAASPPVLSATLANSAASTTSTKVITSTTPLIAFISGPLEADVPYFQQHYLPRIISALEAGHHFVIGPSRGIDSMALEFLLSYQPPPSQAITGGASAVASRITLYLNAHESRTPKLRYAPLIRKLERMGGKVTVVLHGGHTERDEAMTRGSHYDILRYRTEEECRVLYGDKYRKRVSGTEKNEIRRRNGVGLVVAGSPVSESIL